MAAIVGGDGALSLISRHARDKRVTVQREIRQAWEYFDAEEYAQMVLSKNPEYWASMEIYLPHMLSGLRHLPELRDLEIACPVQGVEWMQGLEKLQRLQFSRGVSGISFSAMSAAFPQLRSLTLMTRESVDSFAGLSGLRHLEFLNIFRSRGTDFDFSPFPSLPNLKRLMLHNQARDLDFASLDEGAPRLENLWLGPIEPVTDLSGIGNLRKLTRLTVSPDEKADLAELIEIPHLETLGLRVNWPVDTSVLAKCKSLKEVRITAHNLRYENALHEFDLRPFIESDREWKIQISERFDNMFIGNEHPAVRADLITGAAPSWRFVINRRG